MPNMPPVFKAKGPNVKTIRTTKNPYDWEWTKLRKRRLDEEPLCRHCSDAGYVTQAEQVDHITPVALGGKNVWDNTQSLCLPCHKAKTADDIRAIRKALK